MAARKKEAGVNGADLSPSPLWGGGRGWGSRHLQSGSGYTASTAPAERREVGAVQDDLADPHPPPPPHKGEGEWFIVLLAIFALAAPAFAQDDAAPKQPAAQYAELCGMCHRANGMGTGLLTRRMPPEVAQLEARDNLTADYVTAVVRNGLNNMPPLSRAEVSDEALAAIGAYLAEGPHTPGAPQGATP